jgi:hypothetical protein
MLRLKNNIINIMNIINRGGYLGLRGTRLRRIFGPKRDEAEEDIWV